VVSLSISERVEIAMQDEKLQETWKVALQNVVKEHAQYFGRVGKAELLHENADSSDTERKFFSLVQTDLRNFEMWFKVGLSEWEGITSLNVRLTVRIADIMEQNDEMLSSKTQLVVNSQLTLADVPEVLLFMLFSEMFEAAVDQYVAVLKVASMTAIASMITEMEKAE
jgi:hypothetical protein